jgi:hypothetical protein
MVKSVNQSSSVCAKKRESRKKTQVTIIVTEGRASFTSLEQMQTRSWEWHLKELEISLDCDYNANVARN